MKSPKNHLLPLLVKLGRLCSRCLCVYVLVCQQHYTKVMSHFYSGCLQLLEILEISWNLKTLLEILEISWNLNGPPGNFCVMIENFILLLMALLHDDVALFVH